MFPEFGVYLLRYHGSLIHCRQVTPHGDLEPDNMASGNGLLPVGTKPLPDPMLTSH